VRREIYRGRIVDLGVEPVTLPNGAHVELEVVRHPGAAAVVAVDDAGCVVLIRQFRHVAGGYIWEVPAGILDHPGETPEECAGRELLEETGLHGGRLTRLATVLTTPGFTDERIHLVLAQDLREEQAAPAHDEVIAEVVRMPLREALAMVRRGDIVDSKTICGLYLAATALGVSV
jgi:ADP-ribose diphosphatase